MMHGPINRAKLIIYTVFGGCYFMCICLLLVRVFWLLFIFYLIGCKIGFGGPCVSARVIIWIIRDSISVRANEVQRVIVYNLLCYRTQQPYSHTLRMEAEFIPKRRKKLITLHSERSQKTII